MLMPNQMSDRLTAIEQRLSKVEKMAWVLIGGLSVIAVGWALVQFFFSHFELTIVPKR